MHLSHLCSTHTQKKGNLGELQCVAGQDEDAGAAVGTSTAAAVNSWAQSSQQVQNT